MHKDHVRWIERGDFTERLLPESIVELYNLSRTGHHTDVVRPLYLEFETRSEEEIKHQIEHEQLVQAGLIQHQPTDANQDGDDSELSAQIDGGVSLEWQQGLEMLHMAHAQLQQLRDRQLQQRRNPNRLLATHLDLPQDLLQSDPPPTGLVMTPELAHLALSQHGTEDESVDDLCFQCSQHNSFAVTQALENDQSAALCPNVQNHSLQQLDEHCKHVFGDTYQRLTGVLQGLTQTRDEAMSRRDMSVETMTDQQIRSEQPTMCDDSRPHLSHQHLPTRQ
jgi:hypothetical protein